MAVSNKEILSDLNTIENSITSLIDLVERTGDYRYILTEKESKNPKYDSDNGTVIHNRIGNLVFIRDTLKDYLVLSAKLNKDLSNIAELLKSPRSDIYHNIGKFTLKAVASDLSRTDSKLRQFLDLDTIDFEGSKEEVLDYLDTIYNITIEIQNHVQIFRKRIEEFNVDEIYTLLEDNENLLNENLINSGIEPEDVDTTRESIKVKIKHELSLFDGGNNNTSILIAVVDKFHRSLEIINNNLLKFKAKK